MSLIPLTRGPFPAGSRDRRHMLTSIYANFSPVPPVTDPYFSSVVLLMHMDGVGGGTVFTDVTGKTCTANGGAVTSTSQAKFGVSSMNGNGASDYVLVPNSGDFDFGSGDFTWEAWLYITSSSANQPIMARDKNQAAATTPWYLEFDGSYLQFYCTSVVGSWDMFSGGQNMPLSLNTWTHIAITRIGNTFRAFSGGTQSWTSSNSSSIASGSDQPSVGAWPKYSTYMHNAYLDDLRITKGVGRYSANFTPPSAAFPDS